MTDVRGRSAVNLPRLAMPVFTRQPTITARFRVFAAEDAPARIAVLCRVHVDRGLVRAHFFVVVAEGCIVEERFALATFGAGADGDDKVAHR